VALLALPQPTNQAVKAVATLPSLMANTVFYHGKTVSVIATPTEANGLWTIPVDNGKTLVVSWRDATPRGKRVVVRGLFFDIGRFAQDDSRLSAYGVPAIVRAARGDTWPQRDTLFVLLSATWIEPPDAADTGMRAIALEPARFEEKTVTLLGRFRGQNLYGDAPLWPRQSQWDFILQSADAAIWVTGLRPKGKDFDFDPRTRRNTDNWLEVTGVLHMAQGLPYVAARTVKSATTVEDQPTSDSPAAPPLPEPAVVFSAPADGEPDVNPSSVVRVQFSRPMNANSFDDHVLVSYGPGVSEPPPRPKITYRPGNMSIEIRFDTPLSRFAKVTITLTEGITTREGTAFRPALITFTTGG
jgi:hypothetical protein